jgi:hypothetical protein
MLLAPRRRVVISCVCILICLAMLVISGTMVKTSEAVAGEAFSRDNLSSVPLRGDRADGNVSKINSDAANGTVHKVELTHPPCSELHEHLPSIKVKGCVKRSIITSTTEMITDLYSKGGIRVFPRNGFLLGIVRHGGFLPNEGIDADLGIMYEDLSGKASNFVVQGITHKYTVTMTKKLPGKWATFNGTDPWSKETYDVESVTIRRTDGTSFSAYCFYQYGPDESSAQVFYPKYTVAGYNHDGSMKEARTWKHKGATLKVLGPGNEGKRIEEYAGIMDLGNVFDKHLFESLERTKFYDTSILVPAGYEDILTGFYGADWRKVEKRKNWESLQVENGECFLEPLAVC